MLGKKGTYKYVGILETDTIEQAEMKEKIKKCISGERESWSKLHSRNLINRIDT